MNKPPTDATQNMFSGGLSYLGLPTSNDYTANDVAVLGVPVDIFTSGRSGARFGPRAIRTSSTLISWDYPFGWQDNISSHDNNIDSGNSSDSPPINTFKEHCGVNLLAKLRIIDGGDIPFDFGKPASIDDDIYNHFKFVLKHKCATLAFGGDHYITYPILRAYAEYYGRPLAVIQFDAHSDLWQDETTRGKRFDHGTMMAKAIQDKLVIAEKSVQLGIRTNIEDTLGMNIINAPLMHRDGIAKSLADACSIVGDELVYVTYDMDFLDPAFAPGTGTPCPGGFSSAQSLEALRCLRGINIAGADVVETAPAYDHAEITSLAAATIGANLLCLFAR